MFLLDAILHLLDVLLEAADRLDLKSALLLFHLLKSLLTLLAQDVSFMNFFLHGVAQLLLSRGLFLMTLFKLILQSVEVFAHLPIDVDL